MDWYTVFKLFHVITAITWLGAGAVLLFLGVLASRARNDEEIRQVAAMSGRLALRWFVPSSLLTFVFGAIATTLGGLWSEAWISIALIGFIATFCIGNFVLRPSADRIAAFGKNNQHAAAMAETQRILSINKFDTAMLFVVVADMVLKPSWSDVWVVAVLAVILIAAAVAFLLPAFRRSEMAA